MSSLTRRRNTIYLGLLEFKTGHFRRRTLRKETKKARAPRGGRQPCAATSVSFGCAALWGDTSKPSSADFYSLSLIFFFFWILTGEKKKTRCNRHLCPLLFLELKLAGTGSTSKNFQSSFKMPCLPISFHTSQSLSLTFSIGYIINFSYISLSNAYIKIKLQLKIKPKFAVCIQPYYN